MQRSNYRIDTLLVTILLILCPIADNINGMLLLSGNDSDISSFVKIIIFLLIILTKTHNVKICRKTFYKYMFFIVTISVALVHSVYLFYNGLSYEINMFIKLIYPILLFNYLYSLNDISSVRLIYRAIDFYLWFYPLSLLIPSILGYGYNTYGNFGIGSKGFYYAGNEISGIMVVLMIVSLTRYDNARNKINLFNLLLNIVAAFFVGTKAVFIGIVAVVILYLFKRAKSIYFIGYLLGIILLIIIMCYILRRIRPDFMNEIINMWNLRYTYNVKGQYSNEKVAFMLSGRNAILKNNYLELWNKFGIMGFIFGGGTFFWNVMSNNIIEMDIFDLLIDYGILATFAYIMVICDIFKKVNYKSEVYRIGLMLIIVLLSFLAGHVVFAPSVTIVTVIALIYFEKNDIYSNDKEKINIKLKE